jgi:hypothetical protein
MHGTSNSDSSWNRPAWRVALISLSFSTYSCAPVSYVPTRAGVCHENIDWAPLEGEPAVHILCGVQTNENIGCGDTVVVRRSVRLAAHLHSNPCLIADGFEMQALRHHPLVDECLPPAEAAEIFGVTLCVRLE